MLNFDQSDQNATHKKIVKIRGEKTCGVAYPYTWIANMGYTLLISHWQKGNKSVHAINKNSEVK